MNRKIGQKRRNHDGFLKYIYSQPENARALFRIASKSNRNLREILLEVDLNTLQEISELYNEVDEHGEADIAFKVKSYNGEDVYFGLLLEHKSTPSDNILNQIGRYALNVMVDKSNSEFAWMPTKAIVIYNGTEAWDPLDRYKKVHEKFQGKMPHFEFAFVNLAELDDVFCLSDYNSEASIGVLTMKYAFNIEKYEEFLPEIELKMKSLSFEQCSILVSKIELYLGEFISREALERLKMAFRSIGQRLGFVSAGDERRAAIKRTIKETREEIAKNLKNNGVALDVISRSSGLSVAEVEAL